MEVPDVRLAMFIERGERLREANSPIQENLAEDGLVLLGSSELVEVLSLGFRLF